jgi:hypothetical protein
MHIFHALYILDCVEGHNKFNRSGEGTIFLASRGLWNTKAILIKRNADIDISYLFVLKNKLLELSCILISSKSSVE